MSCEMPVRTVTPALMRRFGSIELLIFGDLLPAFVAHDADFDDAIAKVARDAAGLDIDKCEREIAESLDEGERHQTERMKAEG